MRFPMMLILAVSLTWVTGTPVRAHWPNWSCTTLARWTGYGFSDGYHHGYCGGTYGCGQRRVSLFPTVDITAGGELRGAAAHNSPRTAASGNASPIPATVGRNRGPADEAASRPDRVVHPDDIRPSDPGSGGALLTDIEAATAERPCSHFQRCRAA